MRNVFMLMLLVASTSMAQQKTDLSKLFPGIVQVNERLYYGETEVSNAEYLEYVNWVAANLGEQSEEFERIFPDTLVWRTKTWSSDPYVKHYLSHPAYQSYPVVGVSFEQAASYCEWKTERLGEWAVENGHSEKLPHSWLFRLPTEEEFLTMFEQVDALPNQIGKEGPRRYRGMYRSNLKRGIEQEDGVAGQLNDNADITAPVKSYWPNDYGVYNIKGNVAEWLNTPYHYSGGSWMDLMDEDHSEIKNEGKAASYIGFRCVCSVEFDAP